MNPRVHIVGGGIIGLLIARELLQAGVSVTLLDRQAVGREASWAGGGILSPLYPWRYDEAVTVLVQWGQHQYPRLAAELLAATGTDPEWTESGLLILDANDAQSAANWAQNHGIRLEVVGDRAALATCENAVRASHFPVLRLPDVAQVRNPRLLAALREELRRGGVEFLENTLVRGLVCRRGRLCGIATNRGDLAASRCIVAAGAWTRTLLATTGLDLPIRPVRGQMLLLRTRAPGFSHIVLNQAHYVIPRRDGHVLVGSTVEDVGFEKSTTEVAAGELHAAALDMIPALDGATVEQQWAGLRPATPDEVPYIDEHPDVSGLFVCAGHYRNGIVLAPASARLTADLVLGRNPMFDAVFYRVGRPIG